MSLHKIILAAAFIGISLNANSDVLLIDVINDEPSNSDTGILRPVNGQSMAQVSAKFGDANKTYPAIGEPPITRWNYEKFAVYFEHNLVIHSVVNKPKKAQ